jgi:hypothetical protein
MLPIIEQDLNIFHYCVYSLSDDPRNAILFSAKYKVMFINLVRIFFQRSDSF